LNKISLKKIPLFLLILLPFAIIVGQAPSDIIVSLISILFLINSTINKDWNWLKIKWVKIIFFLWIYLIFASFFALDLKIALEHSILFIRFFIFAIALQYWVLNNSKYLIYILYSTSIAFIFVFIDTFYQFLNFDIIKGYGPDILGYYSNDHFRLTGPFRSNIPGAYLSKFFFIIFLFTLVKLKKRNNDNWIFVPLITLIFFLIFLTGEAMSFASVGLALLILFLLEKKFRKKIILSLVILFCLIFIAIKFNPAWKKIEIVEKNPWHNGTIYQIDVPCENEKNKMCKKKFETQPFFYEVLINFRKSAYWETYNQAITIWKDHSIFGIGIKNYTTACELEKYKKNFKYFFCTTHPHNFFIQWLLETGILGLTGFLILLYCWFKDFIININQKIEPLYYAPLLTLIVIFWPIMSTGSFFSNRNATMNWFIIALCLAINNFKNKKL
tara:strand:+ start:2520 stop:3848 length:1329 start_codon:yes stop_codon:yes gene_type:complete